MDFFELPQHLNLNQQADFLVYHYQNPKESVKQQVLLHMNTFSFLINGYKEVYCNNSPTTIDNNSFVLMKRGHCLMTEKLPALENPYESILFFVSDRAIQTFIQNNNINANRQDKTTHKFSYDGFLKNFTLALIEVSKLEKNLQEKLLANKFQELMHYLIAKQGDNFLSSFLDKINNSKHQLTQVVEANKHQKLSLKELSFLCNMSISTFKREFQKEYHQSPSKWFQEQRMELARLLLKKSRPSEIYEEIGYETLSNFTQAFKTQFGITPKQYQAK